MPRRERNVHSILDALGTWDPCGNEGPVPIQRGTSQADIVGAAIPGKLRPLGALARISTQASRRTAAYRLALGVVVPQVLYYAGVRLRLGGPAIIAVVAWTAVLAVYNWRRSSLSPFVLYGVAVTVSEGAAALLIRDPLVFAAGSVVENLFDGLGFLTSVAVGRPFAAVAMSAVCEMSGRTLLPAVMDRALRRVTLLWAGLFFLRGASLYAALIHLPLGSFLVVSTMAGWPITAVGAAVSLAYLRGAQERKPDRAIASVGRTEGHVSEL